MEFLQWGHEGQGGRETTGGEELRRRSVFTLDASGRNSGEVRAGVEGGELGELPGVEAELMRGSAGVEVQRGGVTTAAQRCGAVEQGGVRVSGFGAAGKGKVRRTGGRGGVLRRKPRISARS